MRIIRGKYGRRRFDVPRNITARPTTDFARENLFNVLETNYGIEGKTALDLFSGTGAVAFEFLSRGCSDVTAVEQAPVQVQFIRSVKDKLRDECLRVVKGDVFKFMQTCTRRFDFIFADPPYDHPRFEEMPEAILSSQMIQPGSVVVVEHSKTRDFSHLEGFRRHLVYGSVNFSIFVIP